MNNISQKIYEYGIVPVAKIDNAKAAVPLAKALINGGIKCIEVTFRTDAAEQAIENICKECPDMLVGAGTVLTTDQIERAFSAGAKFIVTPGFNRTTAEYCVEHDIPVYPGCNDPTSIEAALELGITDLKFFPAEQCGGISMIKALCAPYTSVRFMPTGGISEKNLNDYLLYEKVIACGGSWMVKPDLINNGRFNEIEELTRNAVKTMHGFELRHIGINCESDEDAVSHADLLAKIFGLTTKIGTSSVFTGAEFEFMKKKNALGTHGHICMAVNNLDRAYAYLKSFDVDAIKHNDNGKLKAVNFTNEVGGFVLQLINK